jgi:hypothetical protein
LGQKCFNCVANLLDGAGSGGWLEHMSNFSQVGDHALALRGVGQQRAQGVGNVFRGKTGLKQLGNDAAAGDQVHHGDRKVVVGVDVGWFPDLGRVADEALCQPEGERRDAIDDYERVSDDGGLDRCRTAGDDGGAGVMERYAGVGDETDMKGIHGRVRSARPPRVVTGDQLREFFAVDGGGDRKDIVAAEREAVRHLYHYFQVGGYLLPAAAGQQGDPFFRWVEAMGERVFFAGTGGKRQLG